MAVLLSINVGRAKDITWQDKVVRTAIWKAPVAGRVTMTKLNLAGDEQGDLVGHGGEHRAILVYQEESLRYWAKVLEREGLEPGQFGENFTVTELSDEDVCIGDRYRIGSALFEVTQPRVTCYKVGFRMKHPELPSLMVAHRRPGFYMRVLETGEVGAGDRIERISRASDAMSVADIDSLLYKGNRSKEDLRRAANLPALSVGWRKSFEDLLTASAAPSQPEIAWPGFRRLRVVARVKMSDDVCAFSLADPNDEPLPPHRGGQYVAIRVARSATDSRQIRSYSLCDDNAGIYRIGVKRIEGGVSAYLHDSLKVGDTLEVSAPRGNFFLHPTVKPIVLISAGIGITPLLGMLAQTVVSELDEADSRLWWVHGAHDGTHYAFADEISRLLKDRSKVRALTFLSRPTDDDRLQRRYDVEGRITAAGLFALGVPLESTFYLCGPSAFMEGLKAELLKSGVEWGDIYMENFVADAPVEPGVTQRTVRSPHPPIEAATVGPSVTFARSRLSVHWDARFPSLLALAEACDVPVRWSCRTGVCHYCVTPLIDGQVDYEPVPLDAPGGGDVLICCSRPRGDVELDL
ncbi:MOSC and FAD-binding oxidoreductase domain-containing protein [Dyella sp. C11]|uniref:MOSC and FAD-binding oxidoreductase domain-containing protein n=1 Tax=Dyella sp. C11 TaxID=2126991 RepID=UPI000D6413AB|nr:MOSC and FAD-binding oxidoreductase domain-containing protein [Dyella sp. C11]